MARGPNQAGQAIFIRPAKSFKYFDQLREIRREGSLAWLVFRLFIQCSGSPLQQTNHRQGCSTSCWLHRQWV